MLSRIVTYTDDDTKRTLAQMLYDIINESHDERIDDIIDAYAYRLLGSL